MDEKIRKLESQESKQEKSQVQVKSQNKRSQKVRKRIAQVGLVRLALPTIGLPCCDESLLPSNARPDMSFALRVGHSL